MTLEQLRGLLATDLHRGSQALLGCYLVRDRLVAQIVEVEAYQGEGDPGCHAFRGMTARNRPLFGHPGHAYVYFTYGCHWMLNVVALREGVAGAALIRAAKPLQGTEAMRANRPKAKREQDLLSGPGKLAAAFRIDGQLNDVDLLNPDSSVQIQVAEQPSEILVGTRVGLAPGKGDDLPWRYVDAREAAWASKPAITGHAVYVRTIRAE